MERLQSSWKNVLDSTSAIPGTMTVLQRQHEFPVDPKAGTGAICDGRFGHGRQRHDLGCHPRLHAGCRHPMKPVKGIEAADAGPVHGRHLSCRRRITP